MSKYAMRALEILLELDVVNTDEVKKTVEEFAKEVRSEVGKKWFRRVLARYFLNQPQHNRRFTDEDFTGYDLTAAPEGLRQKILNHHQNELWVFKPDPSFLQELINVVHWIQSNEEDERFLRQLPKITVPVAIQKSHQWNLGRTQVEARVEGVEKLASYPNGWYWAKYVDKETMMVDGKILQNCLQHGYYWDMVASGAGGIFVLRDPQHRPHVAVAVRGKDIIETKGKQNQPIAPSYVSYTVDFFNKNLKGFKPVDRYIQTAGIFTHEGRFGTAKDVGRHIRAGKRDLYVLSDVIFVYAGNEITLKFEISDNKKSIRSLTGDDSMGEIINVLEMLEKTMGITPMPAAARELSERGIHINDGKYGTLADVAERIDIDDEHYLMVTDMRAFIFDTGDARVATMNVSDGGLEGILTEDINDVVIKGLNALNYRATDNLALQLYHTHNLFTYKGRYGRTLEDVADIENSVDGYRTYVCDVLAQLKKGDETAAEMLSFATETWNGPKALKASENAPVQGVVDLCNRAPFTTNLLNRRLLQPGLILLGIIDQGSGTVTPLDDVEPIYSSDRIKIWEYRGTSTGDADPWAVAFVDSNYRFLKMIEDSAPVLAKIPQSEAIRILNANKGRMNESKRALSGETTEQMLFQWLLVREKNGKYYDALEDSQERHYVDLVTAYHKMKDGQIVGVLDGEFMFSIDVDDFELTVHTAEEDEDHARNAVVAVLEREEIKPSYDDDNHLYSFISNDILPRVDKPSRLSATPADKSIASDVGLYKLDDYNYLVVEGSDRYRDYSVVRLADDRKVNEALNIETGNNLADITAAEVFNELKVKPDKNTASEFDLYLEDDTYFHEEEYVNHLVDQIHGWNGKNIMDILANIEKVQNVADGKYLQNINLDRAEDYRNYPDDIEDYVQKYHIILMDSEGNALDGMYINWDRPATEWQTTHVDFIRDEIEEMKEDGEEDDEEDEDREEDEDEF